MDNPYRSPVETEELPQRPHPALNPSYRIDQLEKRFNRLRWCWAGSYLVALVALLFSDAGLGPLELAIILMVMPVALFATRK